MKCKGTMYHGPNKLFTQCDTCHRVSYQMYEGDTCPYVNRAEDGHEFTEKVVWHLAEKNPTIQATLISYPDAAQSMLFVAIIEELAEENTRLLNELADEKKWHPPTTFTWTKLW